jgi:hypothetical protein
MLDLARRRVDAQHHHRDPSLPDALGEQFPAVVKKVKDGLLQFAITGMDVGGEALLMDDFPA